MFKIILATTSPYRIETFGYLGIPFEAEGSNVDESQVERKNPEDLVKTLSRLKAESVARNYPDAIVIGFDSVGFFEGKIFEKPKSKEEAFQRLKNLSEKKYDFYTGVYMVDTTTQKSIIKVVKSEVFMRKLSDSEISRYLDQDPNHNKYAHGYDIKNYASSSFPAKLVGSYTNALMGIPIETVIEMLKEAGYKL